MKDYIQQPRAISRLIRHKSHREDLPSVQEILSSTKEGKISTSPPIQCLNSQFGGPPPDLSGNTGTSNTAYPGHSCTNPGANTSDCANGTQSLVTSGERLNFNALSSPGTPHDFNKYSKYYYARTGGLLRDPSLDQAVTKMHAINHHFDPAATNDTTKNIFLGSKSSNNPNHLCKVENPVLDSIKYPGDNAKYEAAMPAATPVTCQDPAHQGDPGLCWIGSKAQNQNRLTDVVNPQNLYDCYVDTAVQNFCFTQSLTYPRQAVVIELTQYTPENHFYHPYVKYDVTPNYSGAPGFIAGNITFEENENKTSPNTDRTNALGTFPAWANLAVPSNFTASATYYTASYKYNTTDLYYTYSESDTYSTDLV